MASTDEGLFEIERLKNVQKLKEFLEDVVDELSKKDPAIYGKEGYYEKIIGGSDTDCSYWSWGYSDKDSIVLKIRIVPLQWNLRRLLMAPISSPNCTIHTPFCDLSNSSKLIHSSSSDRFGWSTCELELLRVNLRECSSNFSFKTHSVVCNYDKYLCVKCKSKQRQHCNLYHNIDKRFIEYYLRSWSIFKTQPQLKLELISYAVVDIEIELRNYYERIYIPQTDDSHTFYKQCLINRSKTYYNDLFKTNKRNYYKLMLFVLLCKKNTYDDYTRLNYLDLSIKYKQYDKIDWFSIEYLNLSI